MKKGRSGTHLQIQSTAPMQDGRQRCSVSNAADEGMTGEVYKRGFGCRVYNMGGPERLSRVDMAVKVAEAWGYSPNAIISAPSSSVNRGVASPADISMTSQKLEQELGLTLTPFSDALAQIGRLQ